MRRRPRFQWSLLAVLFAGLLWSACADRPDFTAPDELPDAPQISVVSPQALEAVMAVQGRHTERLMAVPGIVGTAVGLTSEGRPAVKLLAVDDVADVPSQLEGFPVELMVTGEFFALQGQGDAFGKPTCGKKNLPPCEDDPPAEDPPPLNARHPRPVPIGVSTGHPAITAGTIGARVTDENNVFVLSNNHVYADVNAATIGDAVIQPGTFDGGSSHADDIGTLDDFELIVFSGCSNVIDAAIAATTTDDVGNSTPSGVGYGTPRSTTMAAAINMLVKKVGRTTGFTKGRVTAINATVNVNYGEPGVACFVNQIIVTPGSFSAGGDSGSLVVVDGKRSTKDDDRKPVGLLYAGSSSFTVLNPIGPVLTRFGVTIDGN
jgi:hypothetical protein